MSMVESLKWIFLIIDKKLEIEATEKAAHFIERR